MIAPETELVDFNDQFQIYLRYCNSIIKDASHVINIKILIFKNLLLKAISTKLLNEIINEFFINISTQNLNM